MEMNHKLFDECSQKYKVEKQKEKEKLRDRDSAWTKIESKARQNPNVSPHAALRPARNALSVQYKNYASSQPELYRPNDNDDDDGGAANITAKEIEQEAKEVRTDDECEPQPSFGFAFQASRTLQKGKPTVRRKSELPHDYSTLNALEKHKRPNDFLSSSAEANFNAQ